VSVLDTLEVVETALARATAKVGELARRVQDFDAELADCDDADECARIAFRRMDVALELAAADTTLRGIAGGLALIARDEKPPVQLGVAA
jgi:hypothetical protein